MAITYTTNCSGNVGLVTTRGRTASLLFIRASDPVRFAVGDVYFGGLPEAFETLKGADAKMWEIARREEAREQNAIALAAEAVRAAGVVA